MLTMYVPNSLTLPPAPVANATILVPDVMPVPLNVIPKAIAPDVIAETVNTLLVIDPVNIDPISPPGPIVYCVCPAVIGKIISVL